MNEIKQILKLILLNISFLILSETNAENLTKKYIAENLPYAIEASQRYGVPKSICLAVGILESGNGTSALAKKNNNHHGTTAGSKQKGRKWRKYNSARDSFLDFARNLKTYRVYASLFALKSNDTKGWANGLEKAGYCKQGGYGLKLARIIKNLNLARLDCDFLVGWAHTKF